MADTQTAGFGGRHVAAFESRRAEEIAELIRRHGGIAMVVPSVREVPVASAEIRADFEALEHAAYDVLVLNTGVGVQFMLDSIAAEWPHERIVTALRTVEIVARGPKPAAVLRRLGIEPQVAVPEPNTWREVLQALASRVAGRRVAIQEYGEPNPELVAGLRAAGAAAIASLVVYRWSLPADPTPLRDAVRVMCAGGIDVAVFTSGVQARHLFQVAGAVAPQLRTALNRVVVASIGPISSAVLRDLGVPPRFEPSRPKMGALIGELARAVPMLLAANSSEA